MDPQALQALAAEHAPRPKRFAPPATINGRSGFLPAHHCRRGAALRTTALRIDRRAHLERAWRTQQEADALEAGQQSEGVPVEVRTLRGLDSLVESAGSSLVVIFFYSRSCGACKALLQHFRLLCAEAALQRAGVRFAVHNVRDEYDDPTAIARLYRVRAVPCFSFLSGGALKRDFQSLVVGCLMLAIGTEMRSMPMLDSRVDPSAIKALVLRHSGRLDAALREMLFRDAPSARK